MTRLLRYAGQFILYAVFVSVIGYFATRPSYTNIKEDHAVIKLTLNHSGKRLEPCRKLTPDEIARLAPNMRVTEVCPRERSPVTLELILDDERLYHAVIQPSGVQRDGKANVYHRFVVPSGRHKLKVQLNDDVDVEGFTHVKAEEITLQPRQVMVIDFRKEVGDFLVD